MSNMKNFDLNAFGVSELGNRQLIKINGGGPIDELCFAIFCLIVEAFKTFGSAINQANCDRAAGKDYIIWADIGHR